MACSRVALVFASMLLLLIVMQEERESAEESQMDDRQLKSFMARVGGWCLTQVGDSDDHRRDAWG